MAEYSAAFKARVVKQLVGPQAVSATRLAAAVGVPQPTLSRWLRDVRSMDGMPRRERKEWTGAEKLRVVLAAAGLEESALGALLRREGVQDTQLTAWRQAAETALDAAPRRAPGGASAEAKRIQALERGLARKDRALAETAALLVLKESPGDLGGRGRAHAPAARALMITLVDAAVASGARRVSACAVLGLSGRTQVPQRRAVPAHVATGPDQLWSWDITYLKTPVRGVFLYLYLILDIWSRKIVGWSVQATERAEHAADLFTATCHAAACEPQGIVLYADNGSPMKGATMLATLERLGVLPSFSRPGVSNDNPFSEALFRTLKYCPAFPSQPFADGASASTWVAAFVQWYNHEHQHSAIRFVTPAQRHARADAAILARRHAVYTAARARQPGRWSGTTRNWSPITTVRRNPERVPTSTGRANEE
ncbi:MAG: IS3 family transposase [Gemmatimonadetes bacterium]|nr:IS3 family transposase [Gemmatimonadota bacterium]